MDIYSGVLAAYMAALVGSIIVGVLVYLVTAYFLSKVFAKAGVQGTWRAWAPVYNLMVFFKLGDLSPWLVLYCFGGAVLLSWIGIGFLFSIALFVGSGVAAYRIGMKLGKEPAFVALWLIPPAWLGVVAYGKEQWNTAVPPAQWSGNAFLADRTVWDGVPVQTTSVAGAAAGAAAAPGAGVAPGAGGGAGSAGQATTGPVAGSVAGPAARTGAAESPAES